MPQPDEQFRARMRGLYAAQFVVIGTYMPFMPAWLDAKGLSPGQIGVLLTVPMLARTVLAPWLAYAVDRGGNRGHALGLMAGGAAAASAALFLSGGFLSVLLIFCAVALFWCALMPVTDATALWGARAAGLDYGRMRLWGSASFIAANLGVGAVVDRLSTDAAIIIIVVAFAAAGWFAFALPRHGGAAPLAPPSLARTRRLLVRPVFLALIGVAALLNGSHAALYGFGTLHWASLGYSGTAIGGLWAIGVVAEIVLFAWSGAAVRRLGSRGLLVLAALAAIVRWVAMTFDPPFAALVPLQLLHGLSFGATHLGIVNLVADSLPERLGATAQSVMYAVSSLAMALATLAAGALYGAYGAQTFWLMAALAVPGLALLVAARPRGKP